MTKPLNGHLYPGQLYSCPGGVCAQAQALQHVRPLIQALDTGTAQEPEGVESQDRSEGELCNMMFDSPTVENIYTFMSHVA